MREPYPSALLEAQRKYRPKGVVHRWPRVERRIREGVDHVVFVAMRELIQEYHEGSLQDTSHCSASLKTSEHGTNYLGAWLVGPPLQPTLLDNMFLFQVLKSTFAASFSLS
jgi:hypothetical protein